jgi:pimeloyl-ACP methyl ester carboxylesterase
MEMLRRALAALAALWLAGCVDIPPANLTPADQIPHLRALRARARSFPRRERFIPAGTAAGRPLRLRSVETGSPTSPRLVLCLHGFLMDANDWDALAGDLGADHYVVALDLPGSGCSDKPPYCALGPEGYTPGELARRVRLALAAVLREVGPEVRVTLVAESLGGVVALRLLGDPALAQVEPAAVARIDRVVLLAPMDVIVPDPMPGLRKMSEAGSVALWVASTMGLSRRAAADFIRRHTDPTCPAPQEDADRIAAIFDSPAAARAAQNTIRNVVPFTPEARPDWPKVDAIDRMYESVTPPCLLIWGARDELAPVTMGYRIVHRLPDARLDVYRDTKHFLASWERPGPVAERIRAFEREPGAGGATVAVHLLGDRR